MPRSFRFVGASLAALLLAAHTLVAQQAAPQSAPPPAQPTFEEFLAGLRAEAVTKGISQA